MPKDVEVGHYEGTMPTNIKVSHYCAETFYHIRNKTLFLELLGTL